MFPIPPPLPPPVGYDDSLPYHLALNEGRFFLVYQPIFDIRWIGLPLLSSVEALVRVRDLYGRIEPPSAFIDIVYRNPELRSRVTWFVINQALSEFNALSIPLQVGVHVNVWAADLEDPTFSDRLMELLREKKFKASRLSLEILEEGRGGVDSMANSMMRLINTGIRIGLDDFGVGVSNLSRVFYFSPSFIKIDRTFCPDPDQPLRTQFCNVITIAAGLAGSIVIQEGIESEIQLHLTRGLGVPFAQGYYLGRPAPLKSVLEDFGDTLVNGSSQPGQLSQGMS